jgi:hypothetical protein
MQSLRDLIALARNPTTQPCHATLIHRAAVAFLKTSTNGVNGQTVYSLQQQDAANTYQYNLMAQIESAMPPGDFESIFLKNSRAVLLKETSLNHKVVDSSSVTVDGGGGGSNFTLTVGDNGSSVDQILQSFTHPHTFRCTDQDQTYFNKWVSTRLFTKSMPKRISIELIRSDTLPESPWQLGTAADNITDPVIIAALLYLMKDSSRGFKENSPDRMRTLLMNTPSESCIPRVTVPLKRVRQIKVAVQKMIEERVQLPRLVYTEVKHHHQVKVNQHLNLTCLRHKDSDEEDLPYRDSYSLVSVQVCIGNNPRSGHYVCFQKAKDGWYKYDDDHVTSIPNHLIEDAISSCGGGGAYRADNSSAIVSATADRLVYVRDDSEGEEPMHPSSVSRADPTSPHGGHAGMVSAADASVSDSSCRCCCSDCLAPICPCSLHVLMLAPPPTHTPFSPQTCDQGQLAAVDVTDTSASSDLTAPPSDAGVLEQSVSDNNCRCCCSGTAPPLSVFSPLC